MKICIITLGCPKNIVDSEYLAGQLAVHKVQFTEQAELADVVIINTCAFILPAREEAVDTILEAVELKRVGKVKQIFVTGCFPQRYINELRKEIPEVDGFFPEINFAEIGKIIARQLKLSTVNNPLIRKLETPAHYAYLKISEGCDNRCRYCTIPIIKGNYNARPMNRILDEAKLLVDNGVRELILVAQDTTYYGWKTGEKDALKRLIKSLAKIDQLKWIRILYAHPAHLDETVIHLFKEEEKLCQYIDIPIQHISNRILKLMGRNTTELQIKNLINRLRTEAPEIAIRTTLMVGYPGENEKDFQILKKFVSDVQFERLGVFKFIPEDGTPAAKISGQIDESLKEDRHEEIMGIQYKIAQEKNKRFLGKAVTVLVDELDKDNNGFLGRTEWDTPLIDNIVHINEEVQTGKFYQVVIDRAEAYDLWVKNVSAQ